LEGGDLVTDRTLRRVVGLLAGLLLVYGAVRVVGMRGEPLPEAGEELAARLDAVVPDQITGIRIVSTTDSVELRRADGRWMVNEFFADTVAVQRLLNTLDEGEVQVLVASNPGNHERLGVDGADALHLITRVATGDGLDLVVGSGGPGGVGTYVRLPSADEVFLVGGSLRSAAGRTVPQWRDRTIVRADTAAIARMVIQRDGETVELVRADSTWTIDGASARAVPVRDLLGGLGALIGLGFPPDTVTVEPVTRQVTGLSAAGDTLVRIEIGDEYQPGSHPLRAPGVDGVIEISDFQADRITPTREALTGG
jgi:hypothetical protein